LKKLNPARAQEKSDGSVGGVNQLPSAGIKDGVLVPFALTACIPESAIRKFAAKEPFAVHVNDRLSKRLILYLGD
jgi:hypothetical protein